jgi:hypothetical protein
MTRTMMLTLVVAAIAGCGGGGGRSVDIPVVPAGEYEADCQAMCTLAAGEEICTAAHAEFCVAKCRARTTGLDATCAACLVAMGDTINGYTNEFGDSYCTVGGPADMTACVTECDDAGAVASPPSIDVLCELECAFYIQGDTPVACSAEGADPCRADCAATVASEGRICAQCLIDQTIPSLGCTGDDCDCEPQFDTDTTFGCMDLCDAI